MSPLHPDLLRLYLLAYLLAPIGSVTVKCHHEPKFKSPRPREHLDAWARESAHAIVKRRLSPMLQALIMPLHGVIEPPLSPCWRITAMENLVARIRSAAKRTCPQTSMHVLKADIKEKWLMKPQSKTFTQRLTVYEAVGHFFLALVVPYLPSSTHIHHRRHLAHPLEASGRTPDAAYPEAQALDNSVGSGDASK